MNRIRTQKQGFQGTRRPAGRPGTIRDGTSCCPFVPGQKSFGCPGVPLSRDKVRSKCPGTNSSVPGRPGTKSPPKNQEKDVLKQKKGVLKQENDVLKQEKDVLKQERKF